MVFTNIVYYSEIPFYFLVAQVLEFFKTLFSEPSIILGRRVN